MTVESHQQAAPDTAAPPRISIGMPGFEEITDGGLPTGRTTLVSGGTGTGKTVMGCQYLAAGIEAGEQGVFISMEEGTEATRQNAVAIGLDFPTWERDGRLHIVEVGADPSAVVAGQFDFGGVLAQIRDVVGRADDAPVRVVIDSLSAAYLSFDDQSGVRAALRAAIHSLNSLGVTTVITAEQHQGHQPGYGLAEYLASVTVVLGNELAGSHRQRTLEVLKARGMRHKTGQFPFVIDQGGLRLLPVSYAGKSRSSRNRVVWGIGELDTLCPLGLYDDSLIVVSGPTGSGKTTLAVEFALAAPHSCLYSLEESSGQLRRNAVSRGVALDEAVDGGDLHLQGLSARDASIDQLYVTIEEHVRQRRPKRVVIDGLAALEQSAGGDAARRFVERLSALAKALPTLILCTYTHASAHREELTGLHASPASDGIVVLRYLFRDGTALRYITVMKLRGDNHDTRTHELVLDDGGLHLGEPVDAALF